MHIPFAEMPDHARLWIFAAPQPLSAEQAERLLQEVDHFLDGWNAHGHPVVGARDWRHDRFLLVAADETATGVSGCSTDTLYRALKGLERELSISLLDTSPVWHRDEQGEIQAHSRGDFRALVQDARADADTLVFDHTVNTVGAVRAGRWELPMRESWHARAFPQPAGR